MSPSDSEANALRDEAAEVARFAREIEHLAQGIVRDRFDRGDAKLLARSLEELRHALATLARYRHRRKVAIFGSARTPAEHADFQHTVRFARAMADEGWMVVTGAGPGIMEAGHLGAAIQHSIGINIRLPFEQAANPIIARDEKLVHLNYFFTRKLVFIKESDGVVLFPGGFGTLDEGFEVLTLLQTGKANPFPVVMLEAPGGEYWRHWLDYVERRLLHAGMISPEDLHLFLVTQSIEEAVAEIVGFYRTYHSLRYVRGKLVIRLNQAVPDDVFERIRSEFGDILTRGDFERTTAHAHEANEPLVAHLPRLVFAFNRRSFGRLRQLINVLNGRA